jgi:hypothetical protein
MQLVHDMWCHPGNDKMEQIFKARRGRGFPRGFITKLRNFHCATCTVSKRTRRYRRSKRAKVAAAKRVKVAAAKRAPQAHTLRKRTSEQEAQKQDWYSYQAVAVPRMSAYFRQRTGSGKSSHRFLPLSQLF